MTEKKRYKVLITETLQKAVIVEASSEQEAHQRAIDAWKNAEYLLGADDFQGVEFHVSGEAGGDDGDKSLERIDCKGGETDG